MPFHAPTSYAVAASIAAIAACSGRTTRESADAGQLFTEDDKKKIYECHTQQCGGNSPDVNGFPVNGLHSAGLMNKEGFRLVPNSIEGNDECKGGTLVVEGTLLAAKDSHGECRDEKLVGTTFLVEMNGKPYRMRISAAGRATIGETDELARSVRNYKIVTVPGATATADGGTTPAPEERSLCNREVADDWRVAGGLGKFRPAFDRYSDGGKGHAEPATPAPAENPDDYLLAIPGEVFLENGEVLYDASAGWFNLACQRDSLAKADIFELAPHANVPSTDYAAYLKKRKAALRMLTANYCLKDRYTTSDVEIKWERRGVGCVWRFCPWGKVEAVWDEKGAVCISRSRLLGTPGKAHPEYVFPATCKLPDCDTQRELVHALKNECQRPVRDCTDLYYDAAYFTSFPNRRPSN